MIFALENPCESPFAKPLRNLAKPCESLRNTAKPHLRICAKACESLQNHICESLRSLSILRKHICESLGLRKYMHFTLANPCENTICETLREVYLLPAPPLLLARSRTRLLSLFILNVFTLFVVTILKPIVSADFLSFVCPKCLTIQVCQPTYE